MSLHFPRVAFSGIAFSILIGAAPALAADARQIADSLVAAATASGKSEASYQDATASGDDVTITGYTMKQTEGSADTVTIPTILITGAQPRDKGGFTAAAMTFDNGTVTSEGTNIKWQTGSLADATVPSPDEIKAKAKIRPFSKIDVAGLNVSGGDLAAPVDIAKIGVTVDMEADGTPRDFVMDIGGINLPPELFAAEAQSKAVLDALGYNGFTVNVGVSGGYETGTDTLTLRSFTIDTTDVGKLQIAGKFSGVSMSKLAGDQAADVAQTGKLDNLTIRFDNTGIVERALDMQAKMMGASRDDVIAQIGGALPFMLNAIGNQPLQDKIAAAGQAFLKDPKSITISATPAAPVPFSQIMSTGKSAPQTLPDLLVVDVTANN